MQKAGLIDFFLEERWNCRGGHPGAFLLVEEDVATTEAARDFLRAKHPEAAKMVDDGVKYSDDAFADEPCDGYGAVARATWLAYWVRWAVKNCDYPVFANS
jgi:hypothetical protein